MSAQHDFSQGERGMFYCQNAEIFLPIYLDSQVQDALVALAIAKDIDLSVLVNDLLKKRIEQTQLTR